MRAPEGTWSEPVANFSIRVVFLWPGKTWLSCGSFGLADLSSIQFISSLIIQLNISLQDAIHFVYSAPDLRTTVFKKGSSTLDSMINVNVMASYNFTTSGMDTSTKNNSIATHRAVGGLCGVAYLKTEQRIFPSAFLKSHVGFGPKGIGGIYEFEDSGHGLCLDASFKLQGVTPSNVYAGLDFGTITRVESLGVSSTGTSRDEDPYGKVWRISIGDIDFSHDDKLYLVNLFQLWLVKIDLSASTASLDNDSVGLLGSLVETYDLVGSNDMPSYTKGEICPYELAFNEEKGCLRAIYDGSGVNITFSYSTFNWDGDYQKSKYVALGNEVLEGDICDVYLSKYLMSSL